MQPNPFRWSFRSQLLLGFLACAALIGFAIFSQLQWGLLPCPLCIFQRFAFAALGIVFLIGALHGPKGARGRRIYGLLALIPAGIGTYISGRHVWLTTLPPDQVPECGPPLGFIWETNSFTQTISKVLNGSGECAKSDWTFLGLSMPAWSLVWFLLLAVWGLYAAYRSR
jgi:disulfide bond formation protein DsbB